jgi:rod shape-determining protein MreC
MHDRTVRRRRAVLALLVVVSLILLTATFGHTALSGLGAIQRGALVVLSPIQDGASKALKPFRDVTGWFSSTLHAKKQRDQLLKQNALLQQEAVQATATQRQNEELRRLVALDQSAGVSSYQPVAASVVGNSPTVWYATIDIDKGTGAGVRVNQPVINDLGLIGRVSAVWSDGAQVTLITDHTSGVSGRVVETGVRGIVEASAGDPNDLRLDYISEPRVHVSPGQRVVTAGSTASRLESLFPPNLPIGQVTKVDQAGTLNQTVHIRPFADLYRLDVVQVLERPAAPSLRAQVPGSGTSMPGQAGAQHR